MKSSLVILLCMTFACAPRHAQTELSFRADSVFINAHKQGEFNDVPYIFYYYTIDNHTDSIFHLNIQRWKHEAETNDKCFAVYRGDTIKLYGGNITPNTIAIEPKNSKHVDFNPDTDDVLDLYTDHKGSHLDIKELMEDIAINAKVYFIMRGKIYIDSSDNRVIKYLQQGDSTIYEWK